MPALLFGALATFTWALWLIGLYLLLGLPLTLLGCVAAVATGQRSGAMLLLTPLPVGAVAQTANAVWTYAEGTAKLGRFNGFSTIDPTTRLERPTGVACLAEFDDLLDHVAADFTLGLLVANFGPQKGAYLGPFPSQVEAEELAQRSGIPIDLEALGLGVVETTEGRRVANVGVPIGQALLTGPDFAVNQAVPLPWWEPPPAARPRPGGHGHVVELGESTLLIRICDGRGATMLVDVQRRRLFARYTATCPPWRPEPGDRLSPRVQFVDP